MVEKKAAVNSMSGLPAKSALSPANNVDVGGVIIIIRRLLSPDTRPWTLAWIWFRLGKEAADWGWC